MDCIYIAPLSKALYNWCFSFTHSHTRSRTNGDWLPCKVTNRLVRSNWGFGVSKTLWHAQGGIEPATLRLPDDSCYLLSHIAPTSPTPWLWRWHLMVLFETLGVLLLLSPFSSVSWGARCSCNPLQLQRCNPLPMRFSTVPYLLNFFIIALTVLSSIVCKLNHYHIYEGLWPSVSFELPILLFSSWLDDKGILHVCYLIFIP